MKNGIGFLTVASTVMLVGMALVPCAATAASGGMAVAETMPGTAFASNSDEFDATGGYVLASGVRQFADLPPPVFTPQVPGFDIDAFVPRWRTRVGAAILDRGKPGASPYVVDSNSGTTILDGRDFSFPFTAGADVGVVRYGRYLDLDFRYFGVGQSSDSVGPLVAGPGAILNVGGGQPSLGPATLAATDRCALQSIEINLRRRLGASRFAVLAGYRFISFHDNLYLFASDPSQQNGTLLTLGATNNMLGWQMGLDGILWDNGGRFRIEGVGKAGVYANATRSSIMATDVGQGQGGDVATYLQRNQTSFVGDVAITGVYQFTPRWALRAGYQLLWLGDVALGPTQVNSLNFATGTIATNSSHGAFYQGALVGIERYW